MTRLLLDTHVALFSLADSRRLSQIARSLIADAGNDVFYSPVSVWEVAIKHARHPKDMPVSPGELLRYCSEAGYREVPLTSSQVCKLRSIDADPAAPVHSDPFDRMLLCQAVAEDMMLLTQDAKLLAYGDSHVVDAR